jgi:hypothetical protein
MIVTIHQPEHLPWLGFFDKMRQADVFVLLDTTQFAKDDFQNRNRIKAAKGATWLTVPVYKKGRTSQLIKDVEICNDRSWGNQHWSLIYQNYKDAPHFDEHRPFFEALYGRQWESLNDLNIHIIRYLASQLGLSTRIITASEMSIYEQGATRVNFAICRQLSARVYLSGAYGKEYLDETPFALHNCEVRYQNFHHPVYPQQWGEFLSHMSAIDLLFNCGDRSLEIIAQANSPELQARSGKMPR